MDWLWWRDRLALARAATIWRARSERERGRPAYTSWKRRPSRFVGKKRFPSLSY
ncbi:hypothetical protein PVAP13_2KG248058 [Panicum virgatum]|uniref:Uncharacterized protein n=1 Tax=Panicum virgatum TaxID=38727 RepID=A0A8T0W7Z8_PANVG|nr:hypothetical protein PVAP13_2KG248058 [Panicum virgatum]